MTRETKARIIEYVILFALLAALLWCAIAGSIVGARNRAEAERDRYFRGATHSVPAMAFRDNPDSPDEWTDEKWAEFCAIYATATPQEREAMDEWLAFWWPNWHPRFGGSRRVIVGGEGRRHRYTRVHAHHPKDPTP